jgi:hypothetical protein
VSEDRQSPSVLPLDLEALPTPNPRLIDLLCASFFFAQFIDLYAQVTTFGGYVPPDWVVTGWSAALGMRGISHVVKK